MIRCPECYSSDVQREEVIVSGPLCDLVTYTCRACTISWDKTEPKPQQSELFDRDFCLRRLT